MKPSILIVDDEPGVRTSLSGVLRDEGYTVDAVSSGEECLDRLTRGPVDLIVLDVWLPGLDGLAIVRRIIAEHGGSIDVGDNTPRGTRFTIELPC